MKGETRKVELKLTIECSGKLPTDAVYQFLERRLPVGLFLIRRPSAVTLKIRTFAVLIVFSIVFASFSRLVILAESDSIWKGDQ
jgi:hypothetical protein